MRNPLFNIYRLIPRFPDAQRLWRGLVFVFVSWLIVQPVCAQYVPVNFNKGATAPNFVAFADVFLDLSCTTATTTITTTILNNAGCTHGIANSTTWGTITGTAPIAVAHTTTMTLGGIVSVDGTQFTTSNPSLGMTFDNTTGNNFITLGVPIGSNRGVVLVGYTPSFGTITGVKDVVVLVGSNGHKGVVQISSGNCGGTVGFDLEESVGSTTTAAGGANCPHPTSATSYFLALGTDFRAGSLDLNVYDSTWACVSCGAMFLRSIGFTAGETVQSLILGNNAAGTTTGTDKFENLVARWSGEPLFPMTPSTNVQDPVAWVAQSHNNYTNTSGTHTTLASTKVLEEHAGDVIHVTCSSEVNSVPTGVTNTAGETFTKNTGSETTGNTQSMSSWKTCASAGHTSQLYTCAVAASQFINIDVQIIHGSGTTCPTFDTAQVTNQTSGATIVSPAFTPSTATGIDIAACYIQSAVAMTADANFFLNEVSSVNSTLVEVRTNAPNSSQTASCVGTSGTSMLTVSNYKQ